MSKLISRLLGLLMVSWVFPAALLAVEGKDNIVLVADVRKYHGWAAWWANLYNGSHATFALVTIICVPLAGVILGTLADLVMSRLGIDLKHRVLSEH